MSLLSKLIDNFWFAYWYVWACGQPEPKPERRAAGKHGRQPAKRLPMHFIHEYARLHSVSEKAPAVNLSNPAYPIDETGGRTEWGMLGNDYYSDCTYAGREHLKMAKAARYNETETWENTTQLVAEYLAYNNGQDVGANIADLLLSWFNSGKILAFAPVDHTNPAKVDAAMAAFTGVYCVAPSTRVLTADLRWARAGDIPEGEALIGFDEHHHGTRRRWRRSVVTRAQRVTKPCYDLTFSDGTKVRCSADHQWLRGGYGRDRSDWVTTADMRTGYLPTSIVKPLDTWETEESYAAGYLAAAFDGEGHLRQRAWKKDDGSDRFTRTETTLGFAQRSNSMLQLVEKFLKEYGFSAHAKPARGTNGDVMNLAIYERAEVIRLLGSMRPVRLLDKFQPELLGAIPLSRRVTLVEKVDAGLQEVVALTTTTGTFVAEGLASHNCGVCLTDDAEDLFSNHQPWTVAGGQQPNPDSGHCIVKLKAGGPGKRDGWITWGGVQESTAEWTAACLEEAWVIITDEDAKANHIDLAALRADIIALGGKVKAA